MPANLRRVLTVDEWRTGAKSGNLPDSYMLRKGYAATVEKAEGDAALQLSFTISTQALDRDNDTVAVAGWKFDNYLKNPVVLWAHMYDAVPVAKALTLSMTANAIKSVAEFTPKDLCEFGFMVYRLYNEGFLNAVSVGFLPQKWAFVEDATRGYGYDILEQELLEYSAVPVPSNPEALLDAKSKGIELAPLVSWAERTLDGVKGAGFWAPRELVERSWQVLTGKGFSLVVPGGVKAEGAPQAIDLTSTEGDIDAAVRTLQTVAGVKAAAGATVIAFDADTASVGDVVKALAAIKAGARHSKADQGMVQSIHDCAIELGACCPEKSADDPADDTTGGELETDACGDDEGKGQAAAEGDIDLDAVFGKDAQAQAGDDIDLDALATEPAVDEGDSTLAGLDVEDLKSLIASTVREVVAGRA